MNTRSRGWSPRILGRALSAVLLATAGLAVASPGARAAQVTIRSFDGTALDADFRPADGLRAGQVAPTVVMTHGFGADRRSLEGTGTASDLGGVGAPAFRARGYNTLTYDSRGFGHSGGTVHLDDPDVEGRDASAVIDWVATRPEAQLDAPGDPRVGMQGASYAGGVQWAVASRDHRIDALGASASWTSLVDALARDGRVKLGWALPLVAVGEVTGILGGIDAPQGIELGALQPEFIRGVAKGAVTGRADATFTRYLADAATGDRIADVRAPTMIVQGVGDTLFPPTQALRMRELLRTAGVPTKTLWTCGGHVPCRTANGAAGGLIQSRILAWMDRWLKDDRAADVGPGFEWASDDGVLRSAPDLPLRPAGTIDAAGSGTLPITPLATLSGLVVVGTPAATAVNVDLPAPAADADVVGEPVVRLRYRGRALPGDTHLYAQLVDRDRGTVVGNQVTPIPVRLDGREHEVERRLEAVAIHATPRSRYRLQITAGSNLYGVTLALGGVDLRDVRVSLPVGDPSG